LFFLETQKEIRRILGLYLKIWFVLTIRWIRHDSRRTYRRMCNSWKRRC